jgi:hypothetical protein
LADLLSLAAVAVDYLSDILDNLQTHMSQCSKDVTIEQSRLLSRCKILDDTAAAVTKKMSQSLNQAVVTAEKIGQGEEATDKQRTNKQLYNTRY